MALGGGLSPKQGHLERLLELTAGIGFNNKPSDPREEALIHNLLAICTRRLATDGQCCAVEALGGGDITIPLLHLCGTTSGVAQSLSLQALKTWAEDHEGCLQACIQAGSIPLLLSVLEASLPASESDVAAAYSASLAVILLRALVRQDGTDASSSFLAANGIAILLNLLTRLQLDTRSLCLVLYLMNDVTRRSTEVLDRAIEAKAVDQVVAVLRQPISEATKFAALILNRWSLAAQHIPAIWAAGSVDALLYVLGASCIKENVNVDPETVAYALSAFAIMTQDAVDCVRAKLLSSSSDLTAMTRAVAFYERCFKGVGFPHAMMCMLLDGSQGAALVAALGANGLLPLWLNARHVGTQLAQRTAQQDAMSALAAIFDPDETLKITIAMSHLLQRCPEPHFLQSVLGEGRLENLAMGAFGELLASEGTGSYSVFSGQFVPSIPSCEDFSLMSPAPSSALEAWTTVTVGSGDLEGNSSCEVPSVSSPQEQEERPTVIDPCTAVVEDPRPQMAPSLSATLIPPSPGATISRGGNEIPNSNRNLVAAESNSCIAALTRLVALTTLQDTTNTHHAASEDASVDMDTSPIEPVFKRQRLVGSCTHSPSPAFKKEDVGVPRYDTLCFVVGGQEVHAVGFVLEAHSFFLRGLLSTVNHVGERVLVPQLAAFSPESMHRLFVQTVEWSYTGEVENLGSCPDTAFDMWALAEFLQIDGLQRYCEAFIEQWFTARPEIVLHSLKLAESYPSAEPLRCRVARHVLTLLVDRERSIEAERVVAAAAAAGHASTLGMAVGAELRERLTTAAAAL
ncbi:hypothetical protein Ndes2526B_g06997 [Nannochloris sp. 'desiccata']